MSLKRARDWSLLVGGILGIVHETALTPDADPQLIMLFAAMIGLPAFLKKDGL